jgi:hypothetical protein
MTERHRITRQAHLQRAHERASGILDEMSQAIVGDRLLPMLENGLGADRIGEAFLASHGKFTLRV